MKALVITIGNVDTHAYPEVQRWLPFIAFTFKPLPDRTFPLDSQGDWSSLSFAALRQEFSGDYQFIQVLFDPKKYNTRMLSCAQQSARDQTQYSQVVWPTIYSEPVHEFLHSLSNLYLPEDTLHQTIVDNSQLADKAFTAYLEKLKPFIEEKPPMQKPLWPLKQRIPIAGQGPMAWRYFKGKKFRHDGRDYKANYEPLYAPEDGIVSWFPNDAIGGNIIKLNGTLYHYLFAHLSKFLKKGAVKKGDQIAVTGNTGGVTSGPHLHLETTDKTNHKIIDPNLVEWQDDCRFLVAYMYGDGDS